MNLLIRYVYLLNMNTMDELNAQIEDLEEQVKELELKNSKLRKELN